MILVMGALQIYIDDDDDDLKVMLFESALSLIAALFICLSD